VILLAIDPDLSAASLTVSAILRGMHKKMQKKIIKISEMA